MKFSDSGLIIRQNRIGESDRALTVLTANHGRVRAFATRARKYNAKNFSATDVLCYGKFVFSEKNGTYRIEETEAIEFFFALRSDIVKFALAQYFCELALLLVPEGETGEEYLRLMLNSLSFLSSDKKPPDIIKAITELRFLVAAGYMPGLVACAGCAKYEDTQMFFDPYGGLIFCGDCRGERRDLLPLSSGVLAAMRHIAFSDFDKLYSFALAPSAAKELSEITEKYMIIQTERRCKTLDFYNELQE